MVGQSATLSALQRSSHWPEVWSPKKNLWAAHEVALETTVLNELFHVENQKVLLLCIGNLVHGGWIQSEDF